MKSSGKPSDDVRCCRPPCRRWYKPFSVPIHRLRPRPGARDRMACDDRARAAGGVLTTPSRSCFRPLSRVPIHSVSPLCTTEVTVSVLRAGSEATGRCRRTTRPVVSVPNHASPSASVVALSTAVSSISGTAAAAASSARSVYTPRLVPASTAPPAVRTTRVAGCRAHAVPMRHCRHPPRRGRPDSGPRAQPHRSIVAFQQVPAGDAGSCAGPLRPHQPAPAAAAAPAASKAEPSRAVPSAVACRSCRQRERVALQAANTLHAVRCQQQAGRRQRSATFGEYRPRVQLVEPAGDPADQPVRRADPQRTISSLRQAAAVIAGKGVLRCRAVAWQSAHRRSARHRPPLRPTEIRRASAERRGRCSAAGPRRCSNSGAAASAPRAASGRSAASTAQTHHRRMDCSNCTHKKRSVPATQAAQPTPRATHASHGDAHRRPHVSDCS